MTEQYYSSLQDDVTRAWEQACADHLVTVTRESGLQVGKDGVKRWAGPWDQSACDVSPVSSGDHASSVLAEDIKLFVAQFAGKNIVVGDDSPRLARSTSMSNEGTVSVIWLAYIKSDAMVPRGHIGHGATIPVLA